MPRFFWKLFTNKLKNWLLVLVMGSLGLRVLAMHWWRLLDIQQRKQLKSDFGKKDWNWFKSRRTNCLSNHSFKNEFMPTISPWDIEDRRRWGHDFEDMRLWGHATLRTKIEISKKCQKMYISQPCARRAPRNPPNDIYSQILAAYIQWNIHIPQTETLKMTYFLQPCARRAPWNPPNDIYSQSVGIISCS